MKNSSGEVDSFDLMQQGLRNDLAETRETARRLILAVSMLSVGVDVILAIVGIALAVDRGSAAIYAFSAECLLDLVSSIIVIWQFLGKSSSHREFLACIALGILFVVSGAAVVTKALLGIIHKELPVIMPLLIVLSSTAASVCVALAVIKLWAARRVTRLACGVSTHSLTLDAVSSFLSAFCALSALVSAAIYHRRHTLWYLDSSMTFLAGLVMVAIGCRVIHKSKPLAKLANYGPTFFTVTLGCI